jgi:hypothetical protein
MNTQRIINVPPRGIGPIALVKLSSAADAANITLPEALAQAAIWYREGARSGSWMGHVSKAQAGKFAGAMHSILRVGCSFCLLYISVTSRAPCVCLLPCCVLCLEQDRSRGSGCWLI